MADREREKRDREASVKKIVARVKHDDDDDDSRVVISKNDMRRSSYTARSLPSDYSTEKEQKMKEKRCNPLHTPTHSTSHTHSHTSRTLHPLMTMPIHPSTGAVP